MSRHRQRHGADAPAPSEWTVALCHEEAPTGPGCQPAVLDRHVYVDPTDYATFQHMEYMAACHGCDWTGSVHVEEGGATEEAHDHAFPGWRTLPAVPCAGPYQPKRVGAETLRLIERLYPAEWVARHGPSVVRRTGRSVPGYSPTGGYEMAIGGDDARAVSAPHASEQYTLF
jgi:Family of unknown function (DUF6349)